MVDVVVVGASKTPFGKFADRSTMDFQIQAASEALKDAQVDVCEIDTVLTGYSTVTPHLMPANILAERLGIRPRVALGANLGGATGLAMLYHAYAQIKSGLSDVVLITAGENRATGQSRLASSATLAQVAEPDYEVPLGGTVPSYYALLSSFYHHQNSLEPGELASLSVQMRDHASRTEGAHFSKKITHEDVMSSPIVADPLHLLECCPVSDGGAAVILCRSDIELAKDGIEVLGVGSANRHQHLSAMSFTDTGAGRSSELAFDRAGCTLRDIDVFGIYDSFTITLAMILEEIGLIEPGQSGAAGRAGHFSVEGAAPLNLHGGLLSYGHSGVAGGLAHLVEVIDQLRARSSGYQVNDARLGYVHGDGGVMSAHVAAVLGNGG